jgi:L-ribulokinase
VFMLLSKEEIMVPGAIGMAKDIFVPGYYGHIFGQSAVGDIFEWFMNNLVPYKYYIEAEEKGISIFHEWEGGKNTSGKIGLVGIGLAERK